MKEKTAFDRIPSRIKYYLLDWKNTYIGEYYKRYRALRLDELTEDQLIALFGVATSQDREKMISEL